MEEQTAPATNAEPALNAASITPSMPDEGSIRDPLNVLKATAPVIASLIPVGMPPSVSTNNVMQGSYSTGPNPGGKPAAVGNDTTEYASAIRNMMRDPNWGKDQYKYGRTYSYGAGSKNMNFDRYYEHPKFKELGFSPYRDNDTHYNENSSWWDDFSRMRGQLGNLAWTGAKSVWGSEVTANEEMEKAMGIGSSSRGGVGGWVTNFGLNTGYTLGIMGEMAVEDLGLAALELGTFGGSTALTGAALVKQGITLGKLGKTLKGLYSFTKELKNVDKAKDFFNASKVLDKTIDFAKWANPLSRSVETTTQLIKGTHGFSEMKNMAKATRTFGNYYRDLRELNVAHSEARLEGEGASKQYQDKLVDDFYSANGRMPEGEEARTIFDKGQSVKAAVTMANDMTIYYSNKLVFEDLFEGIRPGSQIAKAMTGVGRRELAKTAAKSFKKGTTSLLSATESTGLAQAKNFLTKSAYVPWSRKYFAGNLGEALQENAQEVITKSAIDYHNKIDSDPSSVTYPSVWASIGKATGEQFTLEGLNTFAQGYLMGSLIQGGTAGLKSIGTTGLRGAKAGMYAATKDKKTGQSKYGEAWSTKTESQKAKEQEDKNQNDVMNAGNVIADNALIFGNGNERASVATGIKLATEEKRKRVEAGDTKGAQDFTGEAQINQFQILAKTGNMKLITEHVDDMLTLEDKDLTDAYNLDEVQAADVRKKLSTLKSRAERYQAQYDHQQRKNPNTANPWMFDQKKHPEEFAREYQKYQAHENAMADMLFATEDFEQVTERMAKMTEKLSGQDGTFQNILNTNRGGVPVANTNALNTTAMIDKTQLIEHMVSLKMQIDAMKLGTPAQQTKAKDLQTQYDLLNNWASEVDRYKRALNSEHKATISPEEAGKRRERARIQPGSRIVNKKTGEEHVVEKGTKGHAIITKNGKQVKINKDNYTVVKDAPGVRPEFVDFEGDELNSSINRLFDVFKDYMKHTAGMNNGYTFDDQLVEAFHLVKDFFHLDKDKNGLINTINQLSNPQMFAYYKSILENVHGIKKANEQENLKKALDTYESAAKLNKMLNEIYDKGVFCRPEDIETLKNFEPVEFYDKVNLGKLERSDPRYTEIVDILEKYAAMSGKSVKGKDIVEAGTGADATELAKYNAKARKKYDRDKRSYNDHAKQFGFDPTADKSSLSTEDVLREIAKSSLSSPREKALARRLLTVLKPGTKIIFVNNLDTPGSYNHATNEVLVDARYSSDDYRLGEKGHPIEHVILHEIMHQFTVGGLDTDLKFKAQIENLLNIAQTYMRSPEGKAKFGDKPLYGTMNAAEFLAEALTNDTFGALLDSIPFDATGKTTWTELLDAIKGFLNRVFGTKVSESVLDEAMFLISSKLENQPVVAPATVTTVAGTLTATEPIQQSTPISLMQLHAPLLVNSLIAEFRKNYEANNGEKNTLTDDELRTSEEFADFVLTSGSAGPMIKAFNADPNNGRTTAGTSTTATTKPAAGTSGTKTGSPSNKWRPGTKHILTGTVIRSDGKTVNINKTAIEIIEDRGVNVDPNTGIAERIIILKDIVTGEEYTVDLAEPEGKALVTDVYTEPVIVSQHVEKWAATINNAQSGKELKKIYDQIDATSEGMTPELQDLISLRNTQVPQSDIIETEDLMTEYENIKNGQDLKTWKDKAIAVLAGPRVDRDYYETKNGQKFDDRFVDKLELDKKIELANNFKFTDLKVGTIVTSSDGRSVKIVVKVEGDVVYLVSPQDKQNNNMTDAIKATPEDFKSKIKYINGEFTEYVNQAPDLTDAEKAAVATESEALKNVMDPAVDVARSEKAIEAIEDDVKKNTANKFKSCKL